MPVGALITGAILIAVPLMVLMTVWAAVTMARILFPERTRPLDAVEQRIRSRRLGGAPGIRVHDLLEDEERRPAGPAMPRHRAVADEPLGDADPLAEDLWLRRN
jgi:hypothetical protein